MSEPRRGEAEALILISGCKEYKFCHNGTFWVDFDYKTVEELMPFMEAMHNLGYKPNYREADRPNGLTIHWEKERDTRYMSYIYPFE